MQLKMVDREPVDRFQQIVGGKVYGPYVNKSRDGYPRRDFVMWLASGDEAVEIFARMAPLLSSYRHRRYEEVFGAARPG